MTSLSLVLQQSFRHNTSRKPSPFAQVKEQHSRPSGDSITPSLGAHMQSDVAQPLQHGKGLKPDSYFSSPIRTLCESIKDFGQTCITIHDLTEAYNTLSSRIRSLVNEGQRSDVPQPCLEAFTINSEDLARCVSRDVQRVLPGPFDSLPQQYSFIDSTYDIDVPTDVEDIQLMADNFLLCQHALRFASDIFAFPMLHSKFPDTILIALLRDVLFLCKTSQPHVPNLDKARTMVVWMLKMQRLPTRILLVHKHEIFVALQHAMNVRAHPQFTIRLDALAAIRAITSHHPVFVDSLVELLQPVLSNLTVTSLDIRLNAVLALCGFAIAKMKSGDVATYPRSRVREIACAYLDRQANTRPSNSITLLPQLFKSAMLGEEVWQGYGMSFTLAVVSSFLVLVDRFIWTSRLTLRFLVQTIALVKARKTRYGLELWRILIWSFSRLPTGNQSACSQEDIKIVRSTRESAYNILLQEQKHGLLANLVDCLLLPSDGEERSEADVKKALGNVLEMTQSDDTVSKNEGTRLVERLLAKIGRSTSAQDGRPQRIKKSFSWALVDGSLVRKQVQELRVPSFTLDVSRIPPLSETEIKAHWDTLSSAWVAAAQHCLDSGLDLSKNLISAWQSLLLVRGDLIPGYDNFTSTPSFATSVVDILNGFSSPIDTPDVQVRYLTFVLKLWGVLKNVFTSEWLSFPAQELFSALLEKQFAVSNDGVKDVWTRVFQDLIAAGIPSLLHDLDVIASRPGSVEIDVTRQLWLLTAHCRESTSEERHLAEELRFLAIPIGAWDMSPLEFEIWEMTLNRALEIGGRVQQSQHDVIRNLLEMLKGIKYNLLKVDSDVLHSLLSRSLPASVSQVDSRLLTLVNKQLQTCYPIIEKDDAQLEPIIRLLRWLGQLLSMTASSEIVDFITSMQGSLSCWITDERELLRDDLHNEIVAGLYKRSLDLLSGIEPSLSTITHIADFIESAFLHIRGDGALVFNDFWRATYHPRNDIPKDLYPPQIKACLTAWSNFCDDSLADGVSMESQSQSQSQQSQEKSIIHASELAQTIDFGAGNFSEEYQNMSRFEIASTSNDCKTPTPTASRVLDPPAPRLGSTYSDNVEIPGFRYSFNNVASSSKRTAEDPQTPPSQKRRRTTPSPALHRPRPRAGKERAHKRPLYSIPDVDMSRPIIARKRSPEIKSSDDFDTFEREFPVEEFREWQAEQHDHSDLFAPHSELRSKGVTKNVDNEPASDDVDHDQDILNSPLLRPFLLHPGSRSPTGPEPKVPEVLRPDSRGHSKSLLRQQATPGSPLRVFSASVDALAHIRTTLEKARTGAAGIDMEEMIRARRVANEISHVIDEQICYKISSSRAHTPGD